MEWDNANNAHKDSNGIFSLPEQAAKPATVFGEVENTVTSPNGD